VATDSSPHKQRIDFGITHPDILLSSTSDNISILRNASVDDE